MKRSAALGSRSSTCVGKPKCLVYIRPLQRSWPLLDVLGGLPELLGCKVNRLHQVQNEVQISLAVAVAFMASVALVAFVWLVYLLVKATRARTSRWGLLSPSDQSDPHLRLPTALDIVRQLANDVCIFLLGCGLFVIEGERFFRHYPDQSRLGYPCLLCFPLAFGSVGVLRIFMAAARCHLYYASLRNGMLLKLQILNIRNDALLIWFWAGVIITIGCAAQVVLFDEDGAQVSEIRDLAVLSSPIFYMARALRDICNAETMAMKRECKLGLEGICKENPVQIGEKGLDEIEESSFVCMARRREEICPLDSGEEGSFNIRDLRWVGFVSRHDVAGARVPMLLNPSLILTLLGLACLSCAVICRVITAKPELLGLHTLGGTITPKFSSQTTAYSVYTYRSQQVLGLTAEVNPRETSRLSLQTNERSLNSTWGSVVASIGLGQNLYPIQAQISVEDAASTSKYHLDVLEWGLVPESLTFTGTTKLNKHFHRCIPYGYMHPGGMGIFSYIKEVCRKPCTS